MSSNRNTCPACGISIAPGTTACENCGQDLTVVLEAAPVNAAMPPSSPDSAASSASESQYCTQCGVRISGSDRFCGSCGSPLSAAQRIAASGDTARKGRPTRTVSRSPKKSQKSASETPGKLELNTASWLIIIASSIILTVIVVLGILREETNTAADAEQQAPEQEQAAGQQPVDMAQLEALRKQADEQPDDAAAQLRYANALHDAKLVDQAIVRYKLYLEKHPENPDARVDLGICYFEKKDYPSAITEMQTAVAANPGHQLGNYNLGIVNMNAGNMGAARTWFEKARDIDPNSPIGKHAVEILKDLAQGD